MANNIRIVGNILNTTLVSRYSPNDTSLLQSRTLKEDFGDENDYIEYYIQDALGNTLNANYSYLSYKLPSTGSGLKPLLTPVPNTTGEFTTQTIGSPTENISDPSTFEILQSSTSPKSLYPIIEIDPIKDLQNIGYTSGEFKTRYNLFQNKISNPSERGLFIKEISADRTEVRLSSTVLSSAQIQESAGNIIEKINTVDYHVDYLLNFGNNEQYIAVNAAIDQTPEGSEVLFKLYQPLPLSVQEKQTLWVVEEKVTPYVFDINLDLFVSPPPPPTLRGPNFNIPIENQGTIATTYGSYSSLIANLQSLQSSSYNQIQSLLATQSIDINVDYTNFDDFVFFSSAKQRVVNFYTKVKEIENYNNFINKYTSFVATTASLQTNINQYSSSISNIISQFDGYEYYLYFESSSYAWPKSGNNKPFTLLSTGSATVLTWYHALTASAETYDLDNYDNLEYALPAFVRDDGNNAPFLTFLNMVGHYFDNIWIYLKAVTDINLANNNLDYGISRDLVYQQLKSLGVKLYNSQAGDSVNGYLIGANTGSSVFDNNFTITGSYLNNIPRKDLVSELYKRIYHNLPLLLKTKGTVAGLDYLMTTFGIPNQTYYVITSGSISSSFYTPTGSNSTASILSVKEFGGSLKSGLTRGYNNDKVRIVSNTITGSVLSSELSLQTFPTASAAFRDDDLHYVDISFSPETQIDTYISKSIAANTTTWSLDDYIGDPRQQYSASYPDLDAQRKLYFETGVGSYPGFTGSLLDYNGFIRLIEYFDNSLFKMLADFVPERASLSTGVTINSPVLERNKVVYSVPNVSKENIKDADYEIGEITPQYGKLYNDLSGDKKPFFTGELSGSVIDVNQYFEDDFNPYDGDWDVYNSQHTISESIDMNKFLHSDWNVLLNNVSQSVTSSYRKEIEYIYGTTGSLTSSAELQDSYLTLKSYNTSRYDGSKVTSLLYNTYTSGSYTGSDGRTIVTGDNSFGKTAVINRNSYKVGWIKTVTTESLNFYRKTPLNLEYLINSNSELNELNSSNNNWFEVQNIFKSHNPAIIFISDMDQNKRDGLKQVWKSGYSFNPVIYRDSGETMRFTFDNFLYTASVPFGFLKTDPRIQSYAVQKVAAYLQVHWPDQEINPTQGAYYTVNGQNSLQTYNGNNILADRILLRSWPYNNIPKLSTTITSFLNTSVGFRGDIFRFNIFNYTNFTKPQFTGVTGNLTAGFYNDPPGNFVPDSSAYENIFKINRSGAYKIFGGVRTTINFVPLNSFDVSDKMFKIAIVVEKANENDYQNNIWTSISNTNPNIPGFPIASTGNIIAQSSPQRISYDVNNGSLRMRSFSSCTLDLTLPTNNIYVLNEGEYLRISFYFIDIEKVYGPNTGNFKLEWSNSHWGVINQNERSIQYIYDAYYTSLDPFFTIGTTYQPNDTINFFSGSNVTASSYFYSSSFVGTSPNYSSVVNNFSVEKGDLIKFGRFEDPGEYYEVVTSSGYPYSAVVSTSIITGSTNMASNFAILRPKPDETSVILEGRKALGTKEVVQSVLIPFDASSELKSKVGEIVKSVNTLI